MTQSPDRPDSESGNVTSSELAAHVSAELQDQIRTEIASAGGALPFDRFMELALYAPGLGYYVAGAQKFGPGGDFVTAPEISPLFGHSMATQCAEVLERLGGGDILEFGAGSGALAVQVLEGLQTLDALPDRYRILEPSPELQARQRACIQERLPALAERCDWLTRLPEGWRGVVLANEVLDAMPVHRFRIDEGGAVQELMVGDRDGALGELALSPRSPGLAEAVESLQAEGLATAPGYASEINLRAGPWLRAITGSLEAGLAILVDYGYPRSAYYQPDRHMGTLMCHYRHQAHTDPYRYIGLQDITAHVDFTAVAEAGVAAGLELAGFTTQAHFLLGTDIDRWIQTLGAGIDRAAEAKQLLLPTAMGERFKVMGLAKSLAGDWRGFSVRNLSDRL